MNDQSKIRTLHGVQLFFFDFLPSEIPNLLQIIASITIFSFFTKGDQYIRNAILIGLIGMVCFCYYFISKSIKYFIFEIPHNNRPTLKLALAWTLMSLVPLYLASILILKITVDVTVKTKVEEIKDKVWLKELKDTSSTDTEEQIEEKERIEP